MAAIERFLQLLGEEIVLAGGRNRDRVQQMLGRLLGKLAVELG